MDKVNIVVHQKVLLPYVVKDLIQEEAAKLGTPFEDLLLFPLEDPEEGFPFVLGQGQDTLDTTFVDPASIKDPVNLWDLKRRMLTYTWLMRVPLEKRQDLFEAFYIVKFLLQEIKNTKARALGRTIADLPVDATKASLEVLRKEALAILKLPSAKNRIRGSLWKNYSNQLKKTNSPVAGIKDPNDPTGETTLLEELHLLEEEALKKELFFGTSPVLYRKEAL